MSASDAMDTSSQETQPETQPTKPVSGSRRTVEAIREDLAKLAGVPAFDARHPELKPDAIAIVGPFDSSEEAAHCLGDLAWSEPGRSFRVFLDGTVLRGNIPGETIQSAVQERVQAPVSVQARVRAGKRR